MLLSDVLHTSVPFAHSVSLTACRQAGLARQRRADARPVTDSPLTAVAATHSAFAEETLMQSAARCPPQPRQTDSPDEPVDVLILRGPVVRLRYTLLCNRVRDLAASMVGGEGSLRETDSCVVVTVNSDSLISQVSKKQSLTGADRPFRVVGVSGIDGRSCSPFEVALDVKTLVDHGTLLVCTVDTEGSAAVMVLDALRTIGLRVEVETISATTLRETWVHAVRLELALSAARAKQAAIATDNSDANCAADAGSMKSRVVYMRPAYRPVPFSPHPEGDGYPLAFDLEDEEFAIDEGQRASYASAYRNSFAVSRLLAERRLR